jgi:hypothetical protein
MRKHDAKPKADTRAVIAADFSRKIPFPSSKTGTKVLSVELPWLRPGNVAHPEVSDFGFKTLPAKLRRIHQQTSHGMQGLLVVILI